MRVKRVLFVLVFGVLVAALAAPAEAQLAGKQFRIDFFGVHINSPYDLVFIASDCVEFRARQVCFPATFNDCGAYTIDSVDGGTIHFTANLRAAVGTLFQGPMEIHGVVDRGGAGAALGFSFLGRLNSPLLGIPPTGTNGSGHGLQGCFVRPDRRNPARNWTRDD